MRRGKTLKRHERWNAASSWARTLWQEGFGKLVAVYAVSIFGFVIWVGLLISWLFFGGVTPPLAS